MESKALFAMLLSERAVELSNTDICKALADELDDMGLGDCCYVCDIYGDDESGDVVYYCDGQYYKAPYELGMVNDKRTTAIDDSQALNVIPRTTYDEEADETDHYVGMSDTDAAEAKKMTAEARRMLFSERFIGKSERDAADSSDFAGKGKSFPILKPGDIMAAVRSMGRAGSGNKSTDSLKASIIRIAKKKGWTSSLPKAWQDGADPKEAATANDGSPLRLIESAADFLDELKLREARVDYPIKLISPGTGSMAHYPAKVLERDGPKVFKAGTLMFWNHPTDAEDRARPEGDLNNLAAITTSEARWDANGVKGPGLYANAKVMADYAQRIEERAPHIGLSIRAGGTGTGRMVEGKPELKSIDYAESVDYVTRAGRGGIALAEAARDAMILTEAAHSANLNEGGDMTPEEITKLVESAVTKAVTAAVAAVQTPVVSLTERALRGDAREEATKLLESVTLPESSKRKVIDTVLREALPLKDGALDVAKFTERLNAEAKSEGQYVAELTGSGRITGLGGAPVVQMTEADQKAARKADKRAFKESVGVFEELMGNKEAAKFAVAGRAS
jgi:hypothetical protein